MNLILKNLKPFTKYILLIIILTFIQVMADLSLPNYMAKIIDEGIAKHDIKSIMIFGGYMLSISFVGIICAILAGYIASKTALGLGRNLRNSLFIHITGFSLSEFNKLGTASLITRTTNDVIQVQSTVFMMLRMMLRAPLMCIGGVVMAVQKNANLSLILFSMLPVVVILILLVSKKAIPLFKQIQQKTDQLNLILRENLIGIRIIRAFGRIGYEKRRFAQANEDLTSTSIKVNRIMAILNPAMSLSMNLISIAIIWIAIPFIDDSKLMIGDMMAFIQYAMQIFMSLMMLTMLFIMLPRASASAERIKEVLNTEIQIKDKEITINNFPIVGTLEAKHISFRYDNAEHLAIDDISFHAKKGETIAIIGGTGSGKSTLANLILRYYDVERGNIIIDEVDIRDMKIKTLRDKIAYVPQKNVLFTGTVYDNIRFGKQDATKEEIHKACQIAQANDFIEKMPHGYNSMISEGGTNLSGGQKQRLAIARAIVKKAEIYIFDDSFSALDFKTDAMLRKALNDETSNAIVIIIAQRISSIKNADNILVMDGGRIVGQGTHDELLKTNKVYQEIVTSQLSEDEISLN